MNERIKELVEQADIKFSAHWQHQGIDTAVIIPSDLKKFAELIIRECSAFVYNYPEKYLTRNQAREISMSMEEHFGVE